MSESDFDRCSRFISSETRHLSRYRSPEQGATAPLAITISRQAGSGAHCVAACLARYLQSKAPPDSPAWTVFDRNLVEKVLEDHHLPSRMARYMPEDRTPEFSDTLDELLGIHPPVWSLLQQTAETVLRLADRGNVILIGRGAHIITSRLPHVFHVRLVGSLAKRIEHMCELRGVGKAEALALIRREDRGRKRYLRKYFGKDLDDPLSYHLTINTDAVSYERAARLIAEAALVQNAERANSLSVQPMYELPEDGSNSGEVARSAQNPSPTAARLVLRR